jgi:hypothetical protein
VPGKRTPLRSRKKVKRSRKFRRSPDHFSGQQTGI